MFTVRYIPGTTNQLADCLSHLGDQKDAMKLLKLHMNQITKQLSARCDSLQQLRLATQADDELAILKHTIMQGWPKPSSKCHQSYNPTGPSGKNLL